MALRAEPAPGFGQRDAAPMFGQLLEERECSLGDARGYTCTLAELYREGALELGALRFDRLLVPGDFGLFGLQ